MRHAVGWGGLGPALDAFSVATITSATVAAIFCSFSLVLASLSGPQAVRRAGGRPWPAHWYVAGLKLRAARQHGHAAHTRALTRALTRAWPGRYGQAPDPTVDGE
jgi:hypothetical protein